MTLKSSQDLVSGLFFLAIGVFALWIAWDYPLGSPQRMGTGAFPRILCWAMIGLGAVITFQSFVISGERLTRWAIRPLVWVSVGILAFSLMLETVGFVLSTLALLLVSAVGSPETRWREAVIFSIGITFFGVALFIWGLGLPLKTWPL